MPFNVNTTHSAVKIGITVTPKIYSSKRTLSTTIHSGGTRMRLSWAYSATWAGVINLKIIYLYPCASLCKEHYSTVSTTGCRAG